VRAARSTARASAQRRARPVRRQLPAAPSNGAARAALGAPLSAHPSISGTQVCCGFFPPRLWCVERPLERRGMVGQQGRAFQRWPTQRRGPWGRRVAPSIGVRSRFIQHLLSDELCQKYGFENITAFKSKIRNHCADGFFFSFFPLLSDPGKTTSCNVPIVTREMEEKQMKDLLLVEAMSFCS